MGDVFLWILLAVTAAAAVAALLVLLKRRSKPQPPPPYDGRYFTAQLTEMLDTISRATLERDCAEFTELLYEQSRFCEPSDNPAVAPLEIQILEKICLIHPDDSDIVINDKCAEISELLEQRQAILYPEQETV